MSKNPEITYNQTKDGWERKIVNYKEVSVEDLKNDAQQVLTYIVDIHADKKKASQTIKEYEEVYNRTKDVLDEIASKSDIESIPEVDFKKPSKFPTIEL